MSNRLDLRLALFVLLIFAGDVSAAEPPATGPAAATYDPIWDNPVAFTDDVFVFAHFPRDRRTGREVGRATEYVAQDAAGHRESLCAIVGPPGIESAARRADGTWLVVTDGAPPKALPAGITTIDNRHLPDDQRCFSLYADGLLTIKTNIREQYSPVPVYWVPVQDRRPNFAARVLLQGASNATRFLRHGTDIAWLDAPWPAIRKYVGDGPARLFKFDTVHRTVTSFDLAGDAFAAGALCGFDGSVAFDGSHVFDLTTGRAVTNPDMGRVRWLGVVNGLAYGARTTDEAVELVAINLRHPAVVQVVRSVPKFVVPRGARSIPIAVLQPIRRRTPLSFVPADHLFVVGERAAYAWDGQRWAAVSTQR